MHVARCQFSMMFPCTAMHPAFGGWADGREAASALSPFGPGGAGGLGPSLHLRPSVRASVSDYRTGRGDSTVQQTLAVVACLRECNAFHAVRLARQRRFLAPCLTIRTQSGPESAAPRFLVWSDLLGSHDPKVMGAALQCLCLDTSFRDPADKYSILSALPQRAIPLVLAL